MIKIFEGENSFLSKRQLDSLIQSSFKKNPNLSCKIIDADNTSISEIINEYETQDMFSSEKLLVLKRLLSNKEHKDFLEDIASKKENEKINLVIWEEKKIPKNTRYYKLFNQMNTIESFNKFDKRTFKKWALEEIEKEGLKIDLNVLKNFTEVVNYDPQILENEIKKMKLSGKEQITMEDIKENTQDVHNNTIWELLDAINIKNNMKEHTKILLNLLDNGLDPHYLMIMIARNIKQIMLTIKLKDENKNDREIASILKIPPFTLPRLKSIAEKSDYEKLLNLYKKIYNLNYETKVGNIDPELGLILIMTRLN